MVSLEKLNLQTDPSSSQKQLIIWLSASVYFSLFFSFFAEEGGIISEADFLIKKLLSIFYQLIISNFELNTKTNINLKKKLFQIIKTKKKVL